MARKRSIADELRAVLRDRDDVGVTGIVARAEKRAEAEAEERLTELFVDDLLERALAALGTKRSRDEAAEATVTGIGLVGITPASTTLRPSGTISIVRLGEVAALVARFEGEQLDDPHVLERHVRAHNDALVEALAAGPVAPVRFGTVFASEDEVASWLERNEDTLLGELERLRGTAEWAVKIHVVERSEADAEPVGVGTAENYLERRLRAGEAAARREGALADRVGPWHERLAQIALETRAAPGQRGTVLDGAYLVPDESRPAFDDALAAIDADAAPLGLELSLSGPWPAFSFVAATPR